MRKQEFLDALRRDLSSLPKQDVEEHLSFYSEMIDDRIEEGRSEEEAVSDVGAVDELTAQIIADTPLLKIAKERMKPKRRLKAWEIVLLALGSPIWLSLAVAAISVMLSLYVVLCSLIVSVWAVFVSLVAAGAAGVVEGVIFSITGNALSGTFIIGAGFVCTGLSIFLFFGCKAATKGFLLLTKKIALSIKKCFIKRRTNNE